MTGQPEPSPPGGRLLAQEADLQTRLAARSAEQQWLIRWHDHASSTMDVARDLLPELEPGSAGLVLAQQQTAGRGRQGRTWLPVAQGFYGTYLFPARVPAAALTGCSLMVGVVLQEVLQELGCRGLALKWPNDILSESGRKLSGVLIELLTAPATCLLTGIGINLDGDVTQIASAEGGATTLAAESGRRYRPLEVAEALSGRLWAAFRRFEISGFAPFRSQWMRHAAHLGSVLTIQTGAAPVRGRFVGVDESGALLLTEHGAERRVLGGHVSAVE